MFNSVLNFINNPWLKVVGVAAVAIIFSSAIGAVLGTLLSIIVSAPLGFIVGYSVGYFSTSWAINRFVWGE